VPARFSRNFGLPRKLVTVSSTGALPASSTAATGFARLARSLALLCWIVAPGERDRLADSVLADPENSVRRPQRKSSKRGLIVRATTSAPMITGSSTSSRSSRRDRANHRDALTIASSKTGPTFSPTTIQLRRGCNQRRCRRLCRQSVPVNSSSSRSTPTGALALSSARSGFDALPSWRDCCGLGSSPNPRRRSGSLECMRCFPSSAISSPPFSLFRNSVRPHGATCFRS
jgi:hypothetical protein